MLVVRSLPLAPHSRPGNSEDRAVRDPLYPPTPNQVTEGEVRCSDSLTIARQLTEAGIDRAHADALADTIRQAADELPRRGVRSSGEICPVCSMDDEEDEQR